MTGIPSTVLVSVVITDHCCSAKMKSQAGLDEDYGECNDGNIGEEGGAVH